jgi:short-subunit dehydrogenase
VLVTGGSDGMGKAAAKLLGQKGANVVIVGRDVEKMEAVVKELRVCFRQTYARDFADCIRTYHSLKHDRGNNHTRTFLQT